MTFGGLRQRLRVRRVAAAERLLVERANLREEPVGRPVALGLLAGLTAVALAIRIVNIDSDLWLDEIVTVREYASLPLPEILTTYGAANNHLLNSVLVHAAIAAFGYEEWAIRLPALVAGTLIVPAMYWTARLALARPAALAAAAAVAVAYQHVFFSQSARGYAAYMLFGLLASGLLVRALRTDRVLHWALYVVAAVLCVASVPVGLFIVAGHAAVATALAVAGARRGVAVGGAVRHLAAAFAAVGLLVTLVYAGVIGRVSGAAQGAWKTGDAGFEPLSRAFLEEAVRAAGAGSGPFTIVAALVAVALGAIGLVSLARREAPLLAALGLGPLLHLAFSAGQGLAFSPRFLVFWLFPAVLVAVQTIDVLTRRFTGRTALAAGAVGAALLCTILASPLLVFYDLPKQDYRQALAAAEAERGDGLVVAIYTAESGVRYYGVEHPAGVALVEGESFAVARTAQRLEEIVSVAEGRRVVLVTTFPRGLRVGRPALDGRIRSGWRPVASFDGSVGDGDVTIWVPRA